MLCLQNSHHLLASFSTPEKRERERDTWRDRYRNNGKFWGRRECCFSFPLHLWQNKAGSPPEVTQVHLQDLVSQGFMMAAELATYRVPEEPASPAPAEGFILPFAGLYERRFGVPSHQFLHSLLLYYDLELHHLTPLGILHIAAFVTMWGLNGDWPHFDLWNYFFCIWLPQSSGVEVAVFGGMDVYVKSRHGVIPYFHLPMFNCTNRWQKVLFFLRNDLEVL
jgi:hypothetical protein